MAKAFEMVTGGVPGRWQQWLLRRFDNPAQLSLHRLLFLDRTRQALVSLIGDIAQEPGVGVLPVTAGSLCHVSNTTREIGQRQLGVTATRQAAPDENAIDELRDKYPDAFMVGDITPAYGLWTRHIRGLTMIRVGFIANGPDPRPMILTKLDSSELCTGR
jgi:hypothetical protein